MRRFFVAAVACFVVCSPSLFACHAKGHMAVAFAAYQLLTPPIRARADSLFTRNFSIDDWRNRVASAFSDDHTTLTQPAAVKARERIELFGRHSALQQATA